MNELPRWGIGAIAPGDAVEKFVVLAGHNARVAISKDVDIFPSLAVGVHRVIGDQQSGGDERGVRTVVQHDGRAAGQSAVGVAGDTDAGCVHIGQGGHELHRIVHSVGIVFGLPPTAIGNILRIAVTIHINGHDHKASTGILHVVQILHLSSIKPTVAAHDGGRGIVRRGGIRDKQQRAHLMA